MAWDLRLRRGPRGLEDSKKILNHRSVMGRIRVQIVNPDGSNETKIEDDAGGIYRAWVTLVAERLFDRDTGLFEEHPHGTGRYRLSVANRELWDYAVPGIRGEEADDSNFSHLDWCEFAGNFLGKVLFDGFMCPVHLQHCLYQQLLQEEVSLEDYVEKTDKSVKDKWLNQLLKVEDNCRAIGEDANLYLSDVLCVMMTTMENGEEVELVPGGANIQITTANVEEYVGRMLYYEVRGRMERGTVAFCNGFWEVMQTHKVFNSDELEQMMCGAEKIDMQDWQRNTIYKEGYEPRSKSIRYFWDCVGEMNNKQKSELLFFVTGVKSLPLEGFAGLESRPGQKQPFTISKSRGSMPGGHTCTNTLDLPEYRTKDLMQQHLKMAIEYGNAGEFEDP